MTLNFAAKLVASRQQFRVSGIFSARPYNIAAIQQVVRQRYDVTEPALQVKFMSEDEQSKLDAADKASEEATRAVVADILAQPMYSAEEVAGLIAVTDDPLAHVRALRRDRTLFGVCVWDGSEFRHPKFQFRNGTLMPGARLQI